MALPFWMLRDLKVGTSQKLALGFIFSFATVCVALDIVRVVEAISQNQALYTIIEINLVVVISCLPTYRTLLTVRQRRKSSGQSYSWRSLKQGQQWENQDGDHRPLRSGEYNEIEMSTKPIHVTHDIEISNLARDPYPLDPLDTTNKPVRAASTPSVRTQTFWKNATG